MSKIAICSLPETAQLKPCTVDFDLRRSLDPIHLVQYDKTIPILEVSLYKGGNPYKLPEDAEVNIRMGKRNKLAVWNPALGCNEERDKVYVEIVPQMTIQDGTFDPILEVLANGGVAGTSPIRLVIHRNPMQDDDMKDTGEYKALEAFVQQAQASAATATHAAQTVEDNADNIQDVVDNLEAIQGAAGNALAAKNAAEQAKQAAQQAVGFRHFFSALSPDENGDFDPSRPMTTAAAQASWTVKSKGDRIQSVLVNGFASNGKSGGINLQKYTIDGNTPGLTLRVDQKSDVISGYLAPSTGAEISVNTDGSLYSNILFNPGGPGENTFGLNPNIPYIAPYIGNNGLGFAFPFTGQKDLSALKTILNNTPLTVWFSPTEEPQPATLFVPIETQGHDYRCQCLPITEALGPEDTVQSNVPSGFDKFAVFDGSEDEGWGQSGSNGCYASTVISDIPPTSNKETAKILSNYLVPRRADDVFLGYAGVAINISGAVTITLPDKSNPVEYLPQHPLILYYRTASYSEDNDKPAQLETHANGNVYAHKPVDVVAVPYTSADAGKTPGTYDVSSQDGTTVQVSLKAMQDGGDAATLDGHTWADIQKLISDAVASAVALSQ